jgi:hypothetical protein
MIRALILAVLVAVPSSARDIAPAPPPHIVTVDPIVRELLAALWDDSTTTQPERAYCIAYVITTAWGHTAYRVWAIAPAVTVAADPYHITADCPRGPNIALLHVHTPTTCDTTGRRCVIGGPDAYECFASEPDDLMLLESGDPFGLIQCDRRAIIAFYRRH